MRWGSFARSAAMIGGEPYQRDFHIVKQASPGPGSRAGAGDKHIVAAGPRQKGREDPRGLFQPPSGAIALDGAADPATGGESQANRGRVVGSIQGLDKHRAASP